MKCSIVIAVLESYEAVRRQMLYYYRLFHEHPFLRKLLNIYLIDDGSEPSIERYLREAASVNSKITVEKILKSPRELKTIQYTGFPLKIIETNDRTPWTQPRARNVGAKKSNGEYLLMSDIDHILTLEAIRAVLNFSGDKMIFPRKVAILDRKGYICRDRRILLRYGYQGFNLQRTNFHANTFAIKRSIFQMKLNGYNERFCGTHGGDDTDLNRRYRILVRKGLAKKQVKGPLIYVFPDPKHDLEGIFHKLHHS